MARQFIRKAVDCAVPGPEDCLPSQIGTETYRGFLHFEEVPGDPPERGKEPDSFYDPKFHPTKFVPIFKNSKVQDGEAKSHGLFSEQVARRANSKRGGHDVQLFPEFVISEKGWGPPPKGVGPDGDPLRDRRGWASHPAAVTARLRLAQRLHPLCIPEKDAKLANGYYKKPPPGKIIGNPGRFCSSSDGPNPIGAIPARHDPTAMRGVSGYYLAAVHTLIQRMNEFDGYDDEYLLIDPTSKGWMGSLRIGQPKVDEMEKRADQATLDRDVTLIAAIGTRDGGVADPMLEEDVAKGDMRFSAVAGHRHQGPKPLFELLNTAPGLKLPVWPSKGKDRDEWDYVGNEGHKTTNAPTEFYPALADPSVSWTPSTPQRIEVQLAEAMRSRVLVMQHNDDNTKGKAVFLNAWEVMTAPFEQGISQVPHRIRKKEARATINWGLPPQAEAEERKAFKARGFKVEADTTRCDHKVRNDETTFADYLMVRMKKMPMAAAVIRSILWCGPRYDFSDVRGRSGLVVNCHPSRIRTWVTGCSNPTGIHRNGPDNFFKTFGTAVHNCCVYNVKNAGPADFRDPVIVANRLVDCLEAMEGADELLQILADSFLLETPDEAFAEAFRSSLELEDSKGGYGQIGLQHGPSTGLRYYDDGTYGIDEENAIVNLVLAEWSWDKGLDPAASIEAFYARLATSPAGSVLIPIIDQYFVELVGMKGLEYATFLRKEAEARGIFVTIPPDVVAEFTADDFMLVRDPSKLGMIKDWRLIHPWLQKRIGKFLGPEYVNKVRKTYTEGLADIPFCIKEEQLKNALQIVEQKRYTEEWIIS